MTCLKALRDAAMDEPNPDKRYMLRGAADLLQAAIGEFTSDPTLENMIELNGVWAYCSRVLKAALSSNPTPPNAGAVDQRRVA